MPQTGTDLHYRITKSPGRFEVQIHGGATWLTEEDLIEMLAALRKRKAADLTRQARRTADHEELMEALTRIP